MKQHYFFTLLCTVLLSVTLSAQTTEFWGMTSLGGEYEQGVIYKTNENGENLNPVYHFRLSTGVKPQGSLLLASNNNLFGITLGGGAYDMGVLFELNPDTNGYVVRVNFDSIYSGAKPFGTLMQASDGWIYGTTTYGGQNDGGVLFAYNPETAAFEILWNFDGESGQNPRGALTQASNGKLYGMAEQGGEFGGGTLFSYDIVNSNFEKLFDFDAPNGTNPFGSLTEASDGLLYGMVTFGGANGDGVIFKFNTETKAYSKLIDFEHANGSLPYGSLLEVQEGVFYGLTFRGGNDDNGVLFSYDFLNDVYTKKIDFIDSLQGKNPYSSLMHASNGKLYGTAVFGGEYNQGVLFEYDYVNEIYTVKFNFDGSLAGKTPKDRLVEINSSTGAEEFPDENEYQPYPNPTTGHLTLRLGNDLNGSRIVIYNEKGRLIDQFTNFTRPEFHVNIEGSKGVYFIAITGQEGVKVFKVLKE